MQAALIAYYSEADYLAAERAAPVRHEYVAGEVFAMAAASKVHGTLAGNAFIALRQHLRGKPCGVWMADMKVRVKADSAYYYPDVVVTCDPADLGPDAPKDYVGAPKLILEVLSDSTEPVEGCAPGSEEASEPPPEGAKSILGRPGDRLEREKLMPYRRLDSLEEYVLIDQNKAWVEVYRRTSAGWVQEVYEAGDTVRLAAVDLAVPMSELYADSGVEMVAICPS